MLGSSSMQDFEEQCTSYSQCTLVFLRWMVDRVGRSKFLFQQKADAPIREDGLLLVNGSLQFVQSFVTHITSRSVIVIDEHVGTRLRHGQPPGTPLKHVKWRQYRHQQFGGPTGFASLIGTIGLDVVPGTSSLRRSIRNIFDAGRRPMCLRASDVDTCMSQLSASIGSRKFYVLDDVLDPNNLFLPVVHPSHFFKSGWGRRHLSFSEVGAAFGYPRHIYAFLEPWVFRLPPYSVVLAVFRGAIFSMVGGDRVTSQAKESVGDPPTPNLAPRLSTSTWLNRIQRWLPDTWIEAGTEYSKRDDAVVPYHLWDLRISLIFPAAVKLIPLLRDLCLRRYWRNLFQDLRHFLSHHHGPSWVDLLTTCTQHRGSQSASVDMTQKGGGVSPSFTKKHGMLLLKDIEAAREVMEKLTRSSWWEWNMGSSLIFWRWNQEHVQMARDGMTPFIHGELPHWKPKGRKKILEPTFSLIAKKLKTIVERNYVVNGKVSSWTDFFQVPKGEDDIRLVYNGTSCGLNSVVWVPSFWLPFPRSASRVLDYNYYSGDMDLGEMFHNFPLDEKMQEYSGIDLSPFHKQLGIDESNAQNYRWTRTWMGARSSPYSCVRYYYIIEEFVRGNHEDEQNELRWDCIVLNLPGSKSYDPSKPRVQKWDKIKGMIAGDIVTFVDDGRISGQTREHTWAITRQVCSRIQHKGTQVAFRKIHEPRLNPGPWAGAVFETSDSTITKTVTVDKWNKGKRLVEELWNHLDAKDGMSKDISYKELEIARGFLCHLSMTFEFLVPHLKGFHLTLASHLNKRDREGWKYTDKTWKVYLDHQLEEGFLNEDECLRMLEGTPYSLEPPKMIRPVAQLKDDLFAIREFLSEPVPPKIQERSTTVQVVRYGFGDASGSGFGSTIQTSDGLKYRIGVWGSDDEGESSNFKELENVVSTIEEEASCGSFQDSILFFFTDNSTVEAALNKGNSTSRKLFHLVVRFRKVYFKYGTQIIVSHVSGKRMIDQGTDGVSRGNLNEGVGAGLDMLSFVPLHLGAIERHPPLESWLTSWMGENTEFLSPKGWFTRGHDHDGGFRDNRGFWITNAREGIFVWAPAPAAAEVALEELRKAVIKRQTSTHVFVCPRLLTTEWMKQLYKTTDLLISIPAGAVEEAWPLAMHEPLTVGFVFPLLHCHPWQRKSTPQMFHLERRLSGSKENYHPCLNCWCAECYTSENEFIDFYIKGSQEQQLERLSETDVDRLESAWGSLQRKKTEFTHARQGDHLLVPFECDLCIFQKLRGKSEPNMLLNKDKLLMACIRRINLDCFWSRASSTVIANRDRARQALKLSEAVGLKGPFEHTASLPGYDHCGYEVAIEMVLDSTYAGRYSKNYKQWDTIRKIRTVYSSHAKASPQANLSTLAFSDERGKAQRLVSDKCSSYWFSRFFVGCKRRMGQDWRPNKALGTDLILRIIDLVKDRMQESETRESKHKWITFGAYFVITYVMSLRGVEGLLLDVGGLLEHLQQGDETYFIIALLGKVKGEHHHRCHLLPCSVKTSSGILVKDWILLLLEEMTSLGFRSGPAIADWNGHVLSCSQLDEQLTDLLEEIYEESPRLFPASIATKEDISTAYSVFRSLRRSSDTRAVEMNVSHSDITLFNRWSTVERAQGNKATFPMYHHYAQVELLVEPFKRYTFAM